MKNKQMFYIILELKSIRIFLDLFYMKHYFFLI